MTKLPPVEQIQLFITNRRKWGWTDEYIASVLRERLGWDKLDLAGMDEGGKQRYTELVGLLKRLGKLSSHEH